MVAFGSRTNANQTQLAKLGHVHADEDMAHRSSAPRHVSQILPDVLARYGITPESLEQSAASGRRERPSRGGAATLELTVAGAAFELAPVGNPAACAAGSW